MRIRAQVRNSAGLHETALTTNDRTHAVMIPPQASGYGSSVNGGELLFLALATCYCNDLYREAAKRGMAVAGVEVEVDGEFGAEGEPARNVSYRVKVIADAAEADIRTLILATDRLAEIHNTLRVPTSVTLGHIEVAREPS